jgi:hypothetical protein
MRFTALHRRRDRGFSGGWLLVLIVFISLALLVDLVVAPSLRSRGDGFAASILWGASFVAAGAWLVIYLIFKIRGYFRKH